MKRYKCLLVGVLWWVVNLAALAGSNPGITFIENRGQWQENIFYMSRLPGGQVFFQKNKLTYAFFESEPLTHSHEENLSFINTSETGVRREMIRAHAFSTEFIGANSESVISGVKVYTTEYNYFVGDSSSWANHVKGYAGVFYRNLYDGIDLEYRKYGNTVKYDFIVQPEADPQLITVQYSGLKELFLSEGKLIMRTSVNEIQEQTPIAYQIINGKRVDVACSFRLVGSKLKFIFPLGYDPCYELVIDPTLIFSTYSGSTADNWGNTATYDSRGNLYSGGITNHYNEGSFPATTGAYQVNTQGLWDVAILKYDSTGTDLLYATYLGGVGNEIPQSLIANDNDELLIMGVTGSSNFPVTSNAYKPVFQGGDTVNILGIGFSAGTDIFIARLSQDGDMLLASTFMGGTSNDGVMEYGDPLTANYGDESRGDIFIDAQENVLVASKSFSEDFDMVNAFQDTLAGELDAVIFKITPDLSSLLWSTFLGGTGFDGAYSLKTNILGEVIVGGGTTSASNGFENTYAGGVDGWMAKISDDGSKLLKGRYVGGNSYDQVYFIDTDKDGFLYSYGQTRSSNFEIKGAVYNQGDGQFLQKYDAELDSAVFSTTFGSPNQAVDISPTAFLVNDCDNIYISGWGGAVNRGYIGGRTLNMAVTQDAYQSTTTGSDFYLMALSGDARELLYATFLGGNKSATHVDGGTSRFDKRGIVYHAVCAGCAATTPDQQPASDFPTTNGAWSGTNNSKNCNNAAFKFDLASLRARIQTNSVALDQPGIKYVCLPDAIVFQNFSIGGKVYEWDFGDGPELTRSDTSFIVHYYELPGRYKVTLTATDPNTCVGQDVATAEVNVFEPAFVVSDDAKLCEGDRIRLEASGAISYGWVSEDSTFISNERSPVVAPDTTTAYFVHLEDAQGCNLTDTVSLRVTPGINVNFEAIKEYDCISRPPLKLENLTENEGEFIWSLGDGTFSSEDIFTHSYAEDGRYTIKLTGTHEQCVYDKEIAIDIYTIQVPNVFTPAVKEHNDYFEIKAGVGKVDLKIYNRWGKLLFEQYDYQNTWQGEDLPGGVYYYEVEIDKAVNCIGWVKIIK